MSLRYRLAISLAVSSMTLSALSVFAVFALGQTNAAEITGVVLDSSGAVIRGATVTAVQVGTQLNFTATTNEAGQYALIRLPVDGYSLTVIAQ